MYCSTSRDLLCSGDLLMRGQSLGQHSAGDVSVEVLYNVCTCIILPVKILSRSCYPNQHVKKQMMPASWPSACYCSANEVDNWGNYWANKTAVVT